MTSPRPAPVLSRTLAATLTSVLLAGCVPIGTNDPEGAPVALEPQFGPASSAPSAPQPDATTSAPSGESSGAASEQASPPSTAPTPSDAAESSAPDSAPAPPFVGSATVADDPDDRTTTLEPSPDWADLERVTVSRDGDAMTIEVALAGGAPSEAPDDEHTMNIATFFDVDGDGFIDYEIWANLNDAGWGTAWFDNVNESAAFDADDDIEAAVSGGILTIAFDAGKVGRSERFRWATSSEYGRYETIGTDLMARDDAPDDDQPANFPG